MHNLFYFILSKLSYFISLLLQNWLGLKVITLNIKFILIYVFGSQKCLFHRIYFVVIQMAHFLEMNEKFCIIYVFKIFVFISHRFQVIRFTLLKMLKLPIKLEMIFDFMHHVLIRVLNIVVSFFLIEESFPQVILP